MNSTVEISIDRDFRARANGQIVPHSFPLNDLGGGAYFVPLDCIETGPAPSDLTVHGSIVFFPNRDSTNPIISPFCAVITCGMPPSPPKDLHYDESVIPGGTQFLTSLFAAYGGHLEPRDDSVPMDPQGNLTRIQ